MSELNENDREKEINRQDILNRHFEQQKDNNYIYFKKKLKKDQ